MTFALSHQRLGAETGYARTVFVVHGIMGSGRNWRSFATRMVERHPVLRVVLVDLRHHGDSQGAPPPDDLPSCAGDLLALAKDLREQEVVIRHSFGGNVFLEYAASSPVALEKVFVLDCPVAAPEPEGRSTSQVGRVVRTLQELAFPVTRRGEITKALEARGFEHGLAAWMSTNTTKEDGGYRLSFDLAAIQRLLDDYWSRDYHELLADPPSGIEIHIVRALLSDRWSDAEMAQLATLDPDGPVQLHTLPEAGHWLHVDNPEGLLDLLDRWI
ncbi:MAG: alpha/beta hydrolase [Planctomycetes bacterium]|nr:alpha/beta hydrolase [Planctomycetota bacterium]